MANCVRYVNQDKVSVNGCYVSEHIGSVMQDTPKSVCNTALSLSTSAYVGDKQLKVKCEIGTTLRKGDILRIYNNCYTVAENFTADSTTGVVKITPAVRKGGIGSTATIELVHYNSCSHFVEENIVHVGTIMQDAAVNANMPQVGGVD